MDSRLIEYIDEKYKDADISLYDEVTSTNTVLMEAAKNGAAEGTAVIANRQSAGRGRRGKSFYSPEDTGVYISILLRPQDITLTEATKCTTIAAVAVSDAVEKVAGKKAAIKWVNDVFLNERKVCGILTEAAVKPQDGTLDYVIAGIGVNVFTPKDGFPEEIKDVAGSVFGKAADTEALPDGNEVLKNRIAAEVFNRFMHYYNSEDPKEYLEKYKERSFVIGKDINIIDAKGSVRARALDIDDECRLKVRYEDGSEEYISTGEISIRVV